VIIGGVPAEVLYAGAAPGQIAGVAQINVKIPMQIAPGANEVRVTIGGSTSPAGVTVAVK